MTHLRQIWHTLTLPSPFVTDPDARQRAQLLASLVLALIVLGVVALTSVFLFEPGFQFWANATFLIQAAFLVCLLGIYGLSRSRHHTVGAWLTIAIVWGAVMGGAALLAPGENVRGYLAYLSAAILLAGILLSERGLLLVIAASVIGVLLLPLFSHFQDSEEVLYGAIYTIVIAGLIIIFIRHRAQTERRRQNRLETAEKRNRAMLDALPDLMFRLSGDGRYLDFQANNKADLYGNDGELVGQPVAAVLPAAVADLILEHLRLTLARDKLHIFEYELPIQGVVQRFEARMTPSGRDEVVYLVRNITERARMQAALDRERILLRTVIDNIPDTIYFKDAESRFTLINQAQAWTLGVESPTAVIGKTDFDFQPSQLAQTFYDEEQSIIHSGEALIDRMEYNPTRDGQPRWFSATKVPVFGADGRAIGLAGISKDITPFQLAENALRESQERWQSLVANLPGMVTHINREYTVLFLNRLRFAESVDHVLGNSIFDVIPLQHHERVKNKIDAVFQTGQPDSYEISVPAPNGEVVWYSTQLAPVWRAGQVESLILISNDVTENKWAENALRASESRFRAMNDASPFGIFLTDTDGDCQYTNLAYQQLSGLTFDQTLGQGWSSAIHPEDQQRVYSSWYAAAKNASPFESVHRFVRPDGSLVWTSVKAVEIRDEDKLLGYVGTVEDITERKTAQEALSQERNLLRTVIDHLPDYIFVKDALGRFTLSNIAHARAAQSSPEALIGKTAFDVFPADAAAQFYADDETIMNSRQPLINAERMTVNEDSSKRFVLTTKVPLLDSDNMVIGLVGISRDITQRKQTEETLANERNLLRTLIDTIPDYIFVKDTQRRFILSNILHANLIGCTPDELIGKTDFDFFPPELCEQYYADDQEVFRTGTALLNREEIIVKYSDSLTPMLASTSKVPLRDSSGEIIGLVGIARDITEDKQAEAILAQERNLLRTLIDAIPDFVYAKDTQSRYILNNTAHAQSMGCRPNDVVNKTDFDFFPQELAETYFADEVEIFQTGEPLLNHEEVSVKVTDNLTLMIASTSKVPLHNSRGEIIGLVGITRDITEDKRVASQLEEARDQALEASRLKSEFLATMSHEIRTPMNGVIGMTELLLETMLNDEQQDYAQIVLGEANSLLTIINDILDFSKIEAGKMMVESIEFTLPNVVRRVVDMMKLRGADKGLSVIMTIAPDVPTFVCGDPNRLRQVLLNLMGNAVKFTRRGEIEVHVTLDQGQDEHQLVRFAIHDTGIGLSEVARKRLFQPFTQADGSTTRKYGGTGLGLVISKRLTELMGGEIGVESKEGIGSTFWFTIQFAASAQADPLDAAPTDQDESKFLDDKSDVLIMIAEDNPTNQSLALKQLRNLGYRARLVGNGVEAVDEIISHPGQYALILMDCQMPIMDGYEATRLIRAEETNSERHIPIIALTASATMGIREKCLIAGMDDYLSKPVSLEALQAAIEQCLIQKK